MLHLLTNMDQHLEKIKKLQSKVCEYLQELFSNVLPTDKLILLGDFNARVGKDTEIWSNTMGGHGVGSMNNSGLRHLSFCVEHKLPIVITIFQPKNKYTEMW